MILLLGTTCRLLPGQLGSPFVANFPPTKYHSQAYTSSPKNYCILQDKLGTLYISNESTLLAFHGKRWSEIQGSNSQLFYKMALDKEGKVFTGGKG